MAKLCVPANSGLDDCNENLLEEMARELEESSGQELELTDQIFGPGNSDIKDGIKEEIKLQLQPIPGPTRKADASPVGVKSEEGMKLISRLFSYFNVILH